MYKFRKFSQRNPEKPEKYIKMRPKPYIFSQLLGKRIKALPKDL